MYTVMIKLRKITIKTQYILSFSIAFNFISSCSLLLFWFKKLWKKKVIFKDKFYIFNMAFIM